jgi:uncharacterized protein
MEEERMPRELSPAVMIIVTLAAVFLGLQVVGSTIGFMVSIPFYPGSIMEMAEALKDPESDPAMKTPLFIMQGFATLIGSIIVPILLLKRQRKSVLAYISVPIFPQAVLLIMAIMFVFNVANSAFIEWNQNVKFPEFLSGIEQTLRSLEEQLTGMSTYLTQFDSNGQVIIAFIVIAILPAIGEELVFRGIIQNEILKGTRNAHLAIWLSAFIFSVFHLQFYGLVPRMLLGALFGYLYYWSGSLTMSILAHFLNNGLIVLALYLHQKGSLGFNIESTESAPWTAVVSAMVITVVLLVVYKKFFESRLPSGPMDSGTDLSTTLK